MPTLLPWPADWERPVLERRAFETIVLRSVNGTEQRVQLRQKAARSHLWRALLLEPARAARVWQQRWALDGAEVVAPFWPHATVLTAPVGILGGSLACDTTARDFFVGSYAILYASPALAEAVPISVVGGSSLTLSVATTKAWPVGTIVVPGHVGRLNLDTEMARVGRAGLAVQVEVTLDPVPLPASSGTAGAAPIVASLGQIPNRSEDWEEEMATLATRLSSRSGGLQDALNGSAPVVTRRLPMTWFSRAQVRTWWQFYEGRLGALSACWLPSYAADLVPTATVLNTDTSITVVATGYPSLAFPDEARRHLALIAPNGTVVHRRVTAAVDNGNGTETLTLDAAAGVTLPFPEGMLSYCHYARLADDVVELAWLSPEVAEATLTWREVPGEAPASV